MEENQAQNDNQTAPVEQQTGEPQQTTPAQTQETAQPATSGATEEKQEFSDPNMQARFTERMTELKEKERILDENSKKLEAYDQLTKNPDFLKWYSDRLQAEQQSQKTEATIPEISEDEWNKAVVDKNEFQKVVLNQAKQLVQKEVIPLVQELQMQNQKQALERDIDLYADAVDASGNKLHPDFDEVLDSGKLDPYIKALQGSKLSGIDIVDAAYKLAKSENLSKQITEKAHNIVETKKAAIGDKGQSVEAVPDVTKLSISDFYRREARRLGIPPV